MTTTDSVSRSVLKAGAVLVALALIAGVALLFLVGNDRKQLTVDFDRTVALYEGADVRILGVPVGRVDSIEPRGTKVRVTMSWDDDYKVPADAKALIVSPAIVGDRYVQLTPAYTSGPELADDAVLDSSRTALPTELDEVYDSLDQLATALGPEGANKDGALDRFLSNTAQNFDGQGRKFNRMLRDLATFTGTLDSNKDEIFGSVEELERFVGALADNDAVVREFNTSMAEMAEVLADEGDDLSAALDALAGSLGKVHTYVKDNRAALKDNLDGLVEVTDQLVRNRDNLAELLDVAPTTLVNGIAAYNPSVGAFDTRNTISKVATESSLSVSMLYRGYFLLDTVQPVFCNSLGVIFKEQRDPDVQYCNAFVKPAIEHFTGLNPNGTSTAAEALAPNPQELTDLQGGEPAGLPKLMGVPAS